MAKPEDFDKVINHRLYQSKLLLAELDGEGRPASTVSDQQQALLESAASMLMAAFNGVLARLAAQYALGYRAGDTAAELLAKAKQQGVHCAELLELTEPVHQQGDLYWLSTLEQTVLALNSPEIFLRGRQSEQASADVIAVEVDLVTSPALSKSLLEDGYLAIKSLVQRYRETSQEW